MTRIACLGNSHSAAFKLGWDEVKACYPEVTIDFFSGAASAMNQIEVREGRIFPTNEAVREMFVAYAGNDSIAPDYDLYLLVGMGFGLVPLMTLYAKHRPRRFYSRESGAQFISETLLEESRSALIDRSPAIKCLRLVRRIANRTPVFMIPNPLPSLEIMQNPEATYWGNEALLEDCWEYFDRTVAKLKDVVYIPQPAVTLASTNFTKPHYAKDARLLKARWTRPTNQGDPYHMNAAYGIDVLLVVFSQAGILPSPHTDAQNNGTAKFRGSSDFT